MELSLGLTGHITSSQICNLLLFQDAICNCDIFGLWCWDNVLCLCIERDFSFIKKNALMDLEM